MLESSEWDDALFSKYCEYIRWLRPDWPEVHKSELTDHYHFWNQITGHSKGLLKNAENQDRTSPRKPVIGWRAALDSFRSGYNAGSIIRTVDVFSWEGVILGGYSPGPPNKSVCSAAMGSEKWVSLETAVSLEAYLKKIKQHDKTAIFGLELSEHSIPIHNIKFPETGILVLGNEERGLQSNITQLCSKLIEIPMYGRKFSMNVASSFAIAAYLIRTQNEPQDNNQAGTQH